MSNYIEYGDNFAFHPGYYIKELIDESGLTQEDFAKRLDTTPKNLSLLVRGEQSLSFDIAMKLSRMLDTSVHYWLNLQNAYDAVAAEHCLNEELSREREVFKYLDYKYFREYFDLPDLPRKIDKQIEAVRKLLKVSSLSVLTKRDMSVNFRSSTCKIPESSVIKANVMVQLATNFAINEKLPKFNKNKLEKAVDYALTQTSNHDEFYPLISESFREAGIDFIILPNIQGSRINGATKKIGDSILLMVNDRRLNADSFWFTLLHEIGHIVNGDYGISFETDVGILEEKADKYAEDHLIPLEQYEKFVSAKSFGIQDVIQFANTISRDPGIVLGRLQKDGFIAYDDWTMNPLRHKYKVKISK